MNDCDPCELARSNVLSVYYTANCPICDARALAQSPEYWESVQSQDITPAYRSALQRIYGSEWKQAHAKVKGFAALIAAARGLTAKAGGG